MGDQQVDLHEELVGQDDQVEHDQDINLHGEQEEQGPAQAPAIVIELDPNNPVHQAAQQAVNQALAGAEPGAIQLAIEQAALQIAQQHAAGQHANFQAAGDQNMALNQQEAALVQPIHQGPHQAGAGGQNMPLNQQEAAPVQPIQGPHEAGAGDFHLLFINNHSLFGI